jgi:hypothetical protein
MMVDRCSVAGCVLLRVIIQLPPHIVGGKGTWLWLPKVRATWPDAPLTAGYSAPAPDRACDDLRLVGLKLIFLIITRAASLPGLSRREWWKDVEILLLRHHLAVAERERPCAHSRLTWPGRACLALLAGAVPAERLAAMRLIVTPGTMLRWQRDVVRRRCATSRRDRSRPRRAIRSCRRQGRAPRVLPGISAMLYSFGSRELCQPNPRVDGKPDTESYLCSSRRAEPYCRSGVRAGARLVGDAVLGACLYWLSVPARRYAGLVSDCLHWCARDQ